MDKKPPILNDMTSIPHPIIGFVGSLNETIDFNLLTFLARQRPEWSIVLVGPFSPLESERSFMHSRELREAISCKNIYFLGGRYFNQIPNYLKAFDICIIPYKNSEFNRNRSPMKLYEYMASGKPIVSSPSYQSQHFKEAIEVAKSPKSFLEAITRILSGDHNNTQNILKIAKENSWERRAERVLEVIALHVRECE